MSTWLLPENIADVLPSEARKIEELRRRLLDRFRSYGYEMVMPPLLEYLESLLTSGGADLRLRTFKLVDQLSGRTLGLRADITPQVARIDAHLLNRQGVTRLCYAGHVMHTRPRGLHATREQIQIGAEIYGHAGLEADLEIQQLMLDSQRDPSATLRIDIERQVVETADGRAYSFPLGERHKRMVIEGLDTIGMTLANLDDIQAFERIHQSRRPWAIVG